PQAAVHRGNEREGCESQWPQEREPRELRSAWPPDEGQPDQDAKHADRWGHLAQREEPSLDVLGGPPPELRGQSGEPEAVQHDAVPRRPVPHARRPTAAHEAEPGAQVEATRAVVGELLEDPEQLTTPPLAPPERVGAHPASRGALERVVGHAPAIPGRSTAADRRVSDSRRVVSSASGAAP